MFAQQQSTKKAEGSAKSTYAVSDSEFARDAAQANLAEVKFGQLTEQKGTTDAVKDFGKRMVTDHDKLEDSLKTAAQKDNITLPTALSAKEQEQYDRLSKLSGESFDRAYARDMVQDHVNDIAAFRHEANDGKEAAVKSFASQSIPTLQEHLKLAHDMVRNVSAKNIGQTKAARHTGA